MDINTVSENRDENLDPLDLGLPHLDHVDLMEIPAILACPDPVLDAAALSDTEHTDDETMDFVKKHRNINTVRKTEKSMMCGKFNTCIGWVGRENFGHLKQFHPPNWTVI